MKKQLIAQIAASLHSYGYIVYIAASGTYGFYTDGKRVVSFGGQWSFSVDFSGNYHSRRCGSGWQLDGGKELGAIDAATAERFILADAPRWATGSESVTYVTPERHMEAYNRSSKYSLFIAE